MTAEHDENDGQRRRQHEPDRSPNPCPKRRGDNDGDRRQARRSPFEHRLDDLSGEAFERSEKSDCPERHGPPWARRNRQYEREDQPKDGSDEGDKIAKFPPAPPRRTRTGPRSATARGRSRRRTRNDRELCQEKSTQTAAGVVERCGHMRNISRADETDQPVAKVLPLDQDEDDENNDQQRRRERPKQRVDKRNHGLQRAAGRLVHLDRDQADPGNGCRRRDGLLLAGIRLRTLDLLVELLEDDLRTFERFAAAATGAAQAVDLFADRLLILRQIVGEGGDLDRENPAEPGDRREGDQDDNHDRERARQPQSLQRPDRGASMKLRMPASASGISTSRAKYMIATTITPISNAFSVDDVEFTFPPNGAALELAVNI